MRHGRAKAARKTLQFFKLSVGITAPYSVIVDGTFLVQMVDQKVPLRDRLSRILQRQSFQIYVTRSSLAELEMLSKEVAEKAEAFQQARQWGLDHSDGIIEPADIPASSAQDDLGEPSQNIVALIQTKPEYVVCTQDDALLHRLRTMGTSPLIRIARGVVLLEHPSKSSQRQEASKEVTKWRGNVQESEEKLIKVFYKDKKRKASSSQQGGARRTSKRAKGPNPLSCKKRKTV